MKVNVYITDSYGREHLANSQRYLDEVVDRFATCEEEAERIYREARHSISRCGRYWVDGRTLLIGCAR